MTEEKREKVIKGLEWCMCKKHDCYREKGCPYENECDDVGCKYALHRDALALLKAQEPKAVVGIADFDTITAIGGCPACDKSIVNKSDDPTKYCKYCGQAVKWE